MTVEEIIVAKLLSDSNITDLIGDRIYPNEMKEEENPPSLVYLMADETPINAQSGTCLYETILFVSCIANTYSTARLLHKRVVASIDRYDAVVGGDAEIIITRYVGIRGSEKEKDTGYQKIALEFKILNK